MKYRDIIGIDEKTDIGATPILHRLCVAWTAGHETALFDVDCAVYPATTSVWLFPKYFEGFKYHEHTHKFSLVNGEWVLIEISEGMPDVSKGYNFNPFCPYDKAYTGGHFATCKFQHHTYRKKHGYGVCRNTVIVEGRRLMMGVQE